MNIKATVQYNDFVGTSAADASDFIQLEDYLMKKGLDVEKFRPIGVECYLGEAGYFHPRFICEDKETKEIKTFGFEKEISRDEFFNLFKRFDVILTRKYEDIEGREMDDSTIMIDDRD